MEEKKKKKTYDDGIESIAAVKTKIKIKLEKTETYLNEYQIIQESGTLLGYKKIG